MTRVPRWLYEKAMFLFLFLSLGATAVFAAPTLFTDRDQFEAVVPGLRVEGFESAFETAKTVQFADFTVGEESSAANVSSRVDYKSKGERALGFTWNGNGTLLFTFDPPIDAFAADILDFGTCCGATVLNAADESSGWSVTAARGADRPRGNLQFFGIVSDSPFAELVFTSDIVSDNDLIVFDEVSVRAVPEPTALTLMAVAAGCLVAVRRQPLALA